MEKKLHDAFESIELSPEAEERMLAALQAAERERADAQESGDAVPESATDGKQGARVEDGPSEHAKDEPSPAPKRGGFQAWKVVVPLAACLVLGAVVVGVASNGADSGKVETATVSKVSDASPEPAPPAANAGAATSEKRAETESVVGGTYAYEDIAADGVGMAAPGFAMNDDYNTEEYAAVQEGGFVSTATSPLSTISSDVDTASYCNLRRMINDGALLSIAASARGASQDDQSGASETEPYYYDPYYESVVPAGAVRIEEMLNYFTYDYAKPTGDELFSMQAQASTCPWNPDTKLLVMGFATPYERGAADKGANLVFLIDVSGSMDDPEKLPLLQDSFATLLESLDGNDRVSIVTYASGEEVVLDGASGDADTEILKAIYRLRANGSTNGEAGLQKAYDLAEKNFIDGGVNRIIMASDGDLNVGITSESDLYQLVDSKRQTGVYLSVLGFGAGNYKDTKMETLADHGNGSYHYIDCIDEAKRVLSDNLMANLVPFADDVKVQVEFNPAQVKGYRLIGYENRALANEDFRNDEKDAGDVGPNAQFTVAYEIVPVDSPMEVASSELKYAQSGEAASGKASDEWLTCSLRYRAFSDDAVHEQALEVGPGNESATPSDDWKFAASVIEFGMVARESEHKGTSSTDSVLELLNAMDLSEERAGFKGLVEKALANATNPPDRPDYPIAE